MPKFSENTEEASVSGFAGIVKVRGFLVDLDLVPPPENWDTTKDQIKFILKDAVVLETLDSKEFELKDGEFITYQAYCEGGILEEATPSKNSGWYMGTVPSAQALGKTPSGFIGSTITLERREINLFDSKDKKTGEKVPHTSRVWCFCEDEGGDSSAMIDHIRSIVIGLGEKAALRKLMSDSKAKQFPQFKLDHKAGVLADKLGLVVVDGKYADPKTGTQSPKEGNIEEEDTDD